MTALSLRSVLASCLLAAPAFGGVQIVDTTGRGDQLTIAAAVAVAQEGDVVLVRSGSYSGFQIVNKSLVIVPDAGATVVVDGTIDLASLSVGKTLLLCGLRVNGPVSTSGSGPALRMTNALGHVRVEDCVLAGGRGYLGGMNPWNPGAHGVEMNTCFDVGFARCTITGGDGDGSQPDEGFFDFGGKGGDAIRARASVAALYDCTLQAGAGGGGEGAGGVGGRGYDHDQGGGGALFSGCTIRGGHGGYAHGWGIGGAGGHALFATTACHHHLLDCTVAAGGGGQSTGYSNAPAGQLYAGTGTYEFFPGGARTLSGDALCASGGNLHVRITGEPGDRVYLLQGGRTGFTFVPGLRGVRLVPGLAPMSAAPLAILPASGTADIEYPLGALPAGTATSAVFLQLYAIDSGGARFLGSPLSLRLLRCASLAPDCDGNGSFDTCDILANPLADTSHDGILDVCEIDCNQNGIPDGTDIAQGTSADVNGDGVPDSCELPEVIHVDDSAAPFGDGSAAAPFRTIGEGMAAALSGDTILVEDGTYTGALNREVAFGGRSLVLRSAHGPAACVLDLQYLGRALLLHEGESPVTTVRGFTFRNGRTASGAPYAWLGGGAILVYGAGATIEDCVFESCAATQGGGALFCQTFDVTIRDCVFRGNGQATTYSPGGALRTNGGTLRLLHSYFESNQGSAGGAILLSEPGAGVIESCTFVGNSAVVYGGGVVLAAATTFHGCLVAGNSAPSGAGVSARAGTSIVHCTITGNVATQQAGGLYAAYSTVGGGAALLVHDTILWGNSAPTGAEIGSTSFSDVLRLRSCDLAGGAAGVALGAGTLDHDASNLALDPLFVDPDGLDDLAATFSDNDWRLGLVSPCLDAADNTLVSADVFDLDGDSNTGEAVPFDLDGLARFADVASAPDTGIGVAPITDMGAWERSP